MGKNATVFQSRREFRSLIQIGSSLQIRKLRLKEMNNLMKVLPANKGQSLNLNPHLPTVEKFEAI